MAAVEMKQKVVLDMSDPRPVWARPEWVEGAIREVLPDGWTLHVVSAPADGTGDGQSQASEEALEAVGDASVYLGFGVPGGLLEAGTHLEWIHSGAAGVGSALTPELAAADVTFTNSAGIHGPPMAETALAMILHFARGLDLAVANQAESRWDQQPWYRPDSPIRELASSTVGILGFGGVGREVGDRVRALGARVLGLKRSPGPGAEGRRNPRWSPESPAGSSGSTAANDAEIVYGAEGLRRLLAESDYLVVCAPETDETRGVIDGAALAAMKGDAVLVNLARGSLVDYEALTAALEDGRLRGAALDVFPREPFPSDHRLWGLSNVLITPHVSAVTPGFWRRQTALIVENLGRLLDGRTLVNVVDVEAGY